MNPQIAVFDLDGTLVHTALDLVESLNHALIASGNEAADYAALAPFAGTGGRGMLARYCAIQGIKLEEPKIKAIIDIFLEHYEDQMPANSTIYEGAIELITDLRHAGFRTAICTNKPQKLADKLLINLDIAQYFDAICGADFFPVKKPDPKHLTGTIQAAGGDQGRAIMLGDSQTDFDTANAAGIPIIGVTFGYSPVPIEMFKPSKIISHYSELSPSILAAIMKS